MANETALLQVLTGVVDELREVVRDLTRIGNSLAGESRDQVREVQYRVEAMRRYYEYLGTALESVEAVEENRPILKPAANDDR